MGIRSKIMTGLLASTLSLSGGIAMAQDASPDSSPAASAVASPATGEIDLTHVNIANVDSDIVAVASVTENADGVTIKIDSTSDSGLTPGKHGVHIHQYGVCDASGEKPYESSGGHFNPTDAEHGAPDDENSHAGDLGNLTVADDGTIDFEITTNKVTLDPDAMNSLTSIEGSSLIIHSGEDDLTSQPSGDSGERVACGILVPAVEPLTSGTPVMPVASPGMDMDMDMGSTPAS